jgi:hypothetical protein
MSRHDQSPAPRRRWGWPIAALIVLLAVVGGYGLARMIQPPPTPLGPATPSPTASTPSASTSDPMQDATPSATPTLAPRSGWTVHRVTEAPNARVTGVAEARGVLYAFGTHDSQPAIWFSADGQSWTAAEVPAITEAPNLAESHYGGHIGALVDAGDRLVAVAAIALALGSGQFGTMIYASDDGTAWEQILDTPGIVAPDGAPMFHLAAIGNQLVAAGNGVWLSRDSGLSWREAADVEAMGGRVLSLAAGQDVLVAAGHGSTYDITEPPLLAWISPDAGETWERVVLDPGGCCGHAAVGPTGRMLVLGRSEAADIWISDDDGATWQPAGNLPETIVVQDVTGTPTGFVMVGAHGLAYLSSDGLVWRPEPIGMDALDVTWTPTFGLVAAGDPSSIAFGPVPAP